MRPSVFFPRSPLIQLPILTLFQVLLLPLAGCGGGDSSGPLPQFENRPPTIQRVYTIPERVHANQRVSLVVEARDADFDRLDYLWFVSRGAFPSGRILSSVAWETPMARGTDTVQVRVSDGVDTTWAKETFELVLPAPPAGLTLRGDERIIDVSWVASEDEGIRAWRGYEIYVADHTLAGLDEAALAPFLQNEVPFTATPRTFRVGPLADGTPLRLGTLYYAHVRGTRAWDEVLERGAGSPEERAAPRPDWLEPRFTEIRFEGGAAALDLSAGRLHRIDPDHAADVAANDIYLGTSNAEDGAAPLTLKSISHLAYRDAAWGARRVELKRLGRDWTIAATTDDGWQDTVRVSVGQVYAIKTPEGNFAKLRVTAQTGTEPNRLVQVQWAYQLIPNFPAF